MAIGLVYYSVDLPFVPSLECFLGMNFVVSQQTDPSQANAGWCSVAASDGLLVQTASSHAWTFGSLSAS